MSKTYAVTAERAGDWWEIAVTDGLPPGEAAYSQARRLNDVESTAQDLIALLLDVAIADVAIDITVTLPDELQAVVDQYAEADREESEARALASSKRAQVAADLIAAKLTMRETGEILGLSHQRIKQLVDKATG